MSIDVKTNGNMLVITIDISKASIQAAKPSASGKTRLVASTHGSLPVMSDHAQLALSLNLTTKA